MQPMAGAATETGTRAHKERFLKLGLREEAFGRLQGLAVSSLGVGTFLGDKEEETGIRMAEALRLALRSGFNLVDTSINYRDQLSERLVGRVVAGLREKHEFARQEIVISTKGGYLPLDAADPTPAREYLQREYLATGLVKEKDLVAGIHCLGTAFLENQLHRSLKNLNLESVDVYYLHNPEAQLAGAAREEFARRLRRAFEWAEQKVSEGRFQYFGAATWNGFRQDEGGPEYLSLEEMEGLAREVAGASHHFKAVQAPFNLGMPEAVKKKNQSLGGRGGLTLAQAAQELGISLVVSAPLQQGLLARNIPAAVSGLLNDEKETSQRALEFARSGPGVVSCLAGMANREHVNLDLQLMKKAKMEKERFEKILALL